MNFNSQSLLEGTITGVSAAIVIGTWYEVSQFVKRFFIHRSVVKSISRFGVGGGIRGIHITVNNRTDSPIIVREALIIGDRMDFNLNPSDNVKSVWSDKLPEHGRATHSYKFNEGIKLEQNQVYTEIPPFSARQFEIPLEAISNVPFFPIGISVVAEYFASPNKIRICRVNSSEEINEMLQEYTEHIKSEIKDGTINKVRAQFGLSPISLK